MLPFSEYQLEPATSHIGMESRPPRAYSVGSRPTPASRPERHRAYSVGASARARPHLLAPRAPPQASAEDLMLLDFSAHEPLHKVRRVSNMHELLTELRCIFPS